jgi:hypothetical protein
MSEQGIQEGTKHTPEGAPVLRISVAVVLLPTQLQREVFSPRVLNLVTSF